MAYCTDDGSTKFSLAETYNDLSSIFLFFIFMKCAAQTHFKIVHFCSYKKPLFLKEIGQGMMMNLDGFRCLPNSSSITVSHFCVPPRCFGQQTSQDAPSSWTRSSLFTLLEDTRKDIRIPDTGTMHTKRRLVTTLYLIFRWEQAEEARQARWGRESTASGQGASPGRCPLWAEEQGPPFQCPG